jgi:hypothetical protein
MGVVAGTECRRFVSRGFQCAHSFLDIVRVVTAFRVITRRSVQQHNIEIKTKVVSISTPFGIRLASFTCRREYQVF